jgi:hypothetical protein
MGQANGTINAPAKADATEKPVIRFTAGIDRTPIDTKLPVLF